jgi:hypothetical protein
MWMGQDSKRAIWKKKEPFMASGKERAAEARSIIERAEMLRSQNVIVRFNKYLLASEYHTIFTVIVRIPMRTSEIMERMAAAFPGLDVSEES